MRANSILPLGSYAPEQWKANRSPNLVAVFIRQGKSVGYTKVVMYWPWAGWIRAILASAESQLCYESCLSRF